MFFTSFLDYLTDFIKDWQTLVGSFLAVIGSVWVIHYEDKNRIETERKAMFIKQNTLLQQNLIQTSHINLELIEFIKRIKKNIKEMKNEKDSYVNFVTNFPVTTIDAHKEFLKIEVKSNYLFNYFIEIYSIIRNLDETLSNMRYFFEKLIERHIRISENKLQTIEERHISHIKDLNNFIEQIEERIEDINNLNKKIENTRKYNNLLYKNESETLKKYEPQTELEKLNEQFKKIDLDMDNFRS